MCCWNSSAAHKLMGIISGHPMQSRSMARLAYSWKYPSYFKVGASFTYGLISGTRSDVWSDVQHVTNMILLYHLMTRVLAQRNLWAYRVTLRSRRSISECALPVTTYCRSHLFSADRQEKAISRCQTKNMPKSSWRGTDISTVSGEGRKACTMWSLWENVSITKRYHMQLTKTH